MIHLRLHEPANIFPSTFVIISSSSSYLYKRAYQENSFGANKVKQAGSKLDRLLLPFRRRSMAATRACLVALVMALAFLSLLEGAAAAGSREVGAAAAAGAKPPQEDQQGSSREHSGTG